MALEREDIEFFADLIRDDIRGVQQRLDVLNGKTNINSIDIAVLKDRQDTTSRTTRNSSMGWGSGAGAAVGAALIVIYNYFTK
jgi:hypothetical protein